MRGEKRVAAEEVPRGVRVAGAVCWRLLAIAAVVAVVCWLAVTLYAVVTATAVALLLAALLAPGVEWLVGKGLPRTLAAAVVLVGGLAAVGGVLTLVVTTVIRGLPGLQEQIGHSVEATHQWLQHGPLQLSQGQLDQGLERLTTTIRNSEATLTSGALSTASTLLGFLTGLLLVLFTLFFFLRDGRKIWDFVLRVTVPGSVRARVDVAGLRSFASLVAYIRATAAVALMDAAGVGIGTAFVGVPLSAVLAALVFLGAFVPYVGSMVTGTVAVLVALVTTGPFPALVVLAIVVGVMQLEGHVLQPLILGHAVRLHPLAIVLGITAGFILAGAVGAVLAVPITAILNAAIRSLVLEHGETVAADPTDTDEAQVPATSAQASGSEESR